jgi:hypothetical protein
MVTATEAKGSPEGLLVRKREQLPQRWRRGGRRWRQAAAAASTSPLKCGTELVAFILLSVSARPNTKEMLGSLLELLDQARVLP